MELPFNTNQPAEQQPVTVLGRTFATDEERRSYFREELRKQLPELKKIEGFPIGEDEDILKLSDPPYYTACPNPWINDFIAEWETEKVELEAQGKRVADFEVDEPYASDVSEGKNNPIYMAHSYHTKVPHPAIMRYILHYTQPGDVVFDGFAGTGMTGVAAGMCGNPDKEIRAKIETEFKSAGLITPNWGARHAVCGDLSPVASFIAANYIMPIDMVAFQNEATKILNEVQKELGWMYETFDNNHNKGIVNYVVWSEVFICSTCSNDIIFFDAAVDLEKQLIKDTFICPHCKTVHTKKSINKKWITVYDNALKKTIIQTAAVPVIINNTVGRNRSERRPTQFDLDLIDKISNYSSNYEIPIVELPNGYNTDQPIRSNGITHIHHFYTKRNLIYLSALFEKAKKMPLLKIWITSGMIRTTKMYKFTIDRKFGTVSGTLYIPSLNVENSPYKLLKSKINDFAKTDYEREINSLSHVNSSTNLKTILNSSVDYIFVDPPFGANIMYSELNIIWESWLKVRTDNHKEAIENKYQNKDIFDYQSLMVESFVEFYRILKSGKWMTVEFSNTNAGIWNTIQNSLQKVGFIVANVSALDKKQGSFKSVTTTTAVKQDLVISCYKPSSEFDTKFQQNQHSEVGIWDFVTEHLSHLPVHLIKDNATTAVIERSPKILFDRLIAFYVQRNLPVPIDAGLFQKGLKERFFERDGMYFTAEQVHEFDSKKAELPNFVQLSLLVASEQDGVMWLRRELEHTAQTYQELQPKWMQALAGVRKGDILPELKDILEENFLQDVSGAWYLPDLENEIDLEKVRTSRMLRLFATYREQASKPKGKLKEARVEALRVGFKQCYKDKDFKTIVTIGDCIPNNLLMEDEVLLQYYDIAISRV